MPIRHLAAALTAAALVGRPLAAQQSPLQPCTYDACALRVEPRLFGSPRIVRGAAGVPVGSIGPLGADLEEIVQGADSAVRHARDYRRAQTRGLVATVGGAALFAVGLAQCDEDGLLFEGCSSGAGALALGGLGATLYGAFEYSRANRSLSRSLWWYNRALPR